MRRKETAANGFSLIEVIAATLIVGVVLAVSVRGLGRAVQGRVRMRDQERAIQLANDLIAEALSTSYQDPDVTGSGSIGLDSGETSTNRSMFDDVDDYHLYSESPLQSRSGSVIANTSGWTRSVYVVWTNPSSLEEPTATDQGVKVVAVQVTTPSGHVVEASAIRCRLDKQIP